MAKRKPTPANKQVSPPQDIRSVDNHDSRIKWIIGGVAFLLILGFFVFTRVNKNDNAAASLTSSSSQIPSPAAVESNDPAPASTSSSDLPDDVSKKIAGDWYVKERLIAGNPTTKGKIGMGSWQFYDDGSLKYTTSQYADLGTWKVEGEKLTVSLYALGNYSGIVTELNATSLTWVTKETIDGQPVDVTNRFARRK